MSCSWELNLCSMWSTFWQDSVIKTKTNESHFLFLLAHKSAHFHQKETTWTGSTAVFQRHTAYEWALKVRFKENVTLLLEHKSTSVLNKRKICRPNTINRNQSDGGEKWGKSNSILSLTSQVRFSKSVNTCSLSDQIN